MTSHAALSEFIAQLDRLAGIWTGDLREGTPPTVRIVRTYLLLPDDQQRQARTKLVDAILETPRRPESAGRLYDLLLLIPDLRPAEAKSLIAQFALDPSLAELVHGEVDVRMLAASLAPVFPFDAVFYEQLLNQSGAEDSPLLTLATSRAVLESEHSALHVRALRALLEHSPQTIGVKQLSALFSYLDIHLANRRVWSWLCLQRTQKSGLWDAFRPAWAEALSLERSLSLGGYASLLYVEANAETIDLQDAVGLLSRAASILATPEDAAAALEYLTQQRLLKIADIEASYAERISGELVDKCVVVYSPEDPGTVIPLTSSQILDAVEVEAYG